MGDLCKREFGYPCYDPSKDILLPGYLPQSTAPATPVFQDRQISVLYRFSSSGHTAESKYHSRLIRTELLHEHELHPIPLSDWALRSVNDTLHDMTNSTFCVAPPGVVAHTSRFWKALRRGCIPVTFFRAFDLPFSSAIDYQAATVNIQPDNVQSMSSVLTSILSNPDKLLSLQLNVEKIQKMIVWWDEQSIAGVEHLFWDQISKLVVVS